MIKNEHNWTIVCYGISPGIEGLITNIMGLGRPKMKLQRFHAVAFLVIPVDRKSVV